MPKITNWSFDGEGRGSKAPASIQDIVRSWTHDEFPTHVWVERSNDEITGEERFTVWIAEDDTGIIDTLDQRDTSDAAKEAAIGWMENHPNAGRIAESPSPVDEESLKDLLGY